MESVTMGRVTCEALVENLEDSWDVEKNILASDAARKLIIPQALVDTGAAFLSLPSRMIKQLGLKRRGSKSVMTSGGVAQADMYDAVRLTIQGRDCVLQVLEVPDAVPPLVGYIALELLDFAVDPKAQKLIGNPAHGGEHMYDLL